jgi:hypothetical protein
VIDRAGEPGEPRGTRVASARHLVAVIGGARQQVAALERAQRALSAHDIAHRIERAFVEVAEQLWPIEVCGVAAVVVLLARARAAGPADAEGPGACERAEDGELAEVADVACVAVLHQPAVSSPRRRSCHM